MRIVGRMRVLLVDDDVPFGTAVERRLRGRGIDVIHNGIPAMGAMFGQ